MSDTRYLISEAAKLTDTDPHVLRYWEDELKLHIGRNQMGHRYYTGRDLHVFMEIKELKNQGLSLKAIRERVPAIYETAPEDALPPLSAEDPQQPKESAKKACAEAAATITQPVPRIRKKPQPEKTEEPKDMVQLADKVVTDACEMTAEKRERFNQILERLIDQVIQSEHQEARTRRLDEAIRRRQQSRKQVAATAEKGFGKRKKGSKT